MVDFAVNDTTTTTYNDVSYASIITDEVLDALMATVVTPPLLRMTDLSGAASNVAKYPKADKFTAAAVAEGVELANTALTSDSVSITASEIGIMATVTDVLEVSDIPAAHGARLRQLGRSLADKMDVDICTLFGGITAEVGSTGVDLSLANVLDAIYTLEAADAAGTGSFVAVFHPRQIADIRTELEADAASIYTTGSGNAQSGSQQLSKSNGGYFGNWFGIDFFQTTNVLAVNAAADRSGAIFTRDYAFGMVNKWGARVETMRWAPIRGWVLVATAMYGVGMIEDSAAVEVITDA